MLVVTLLFFKFLPEKYDFDLHNRLFMGKKKPPQIHQILKIFLVLFFQIAIFLWYVKLVVKNIIEVFFFFFFFFSPYLHI
jgi:hypothetical protein